jgi:hypothetical protein
MACLFFDQVNNNAKIGVLHPLQGEPSTDLSTVFVDNARSRCQTKTYKNQGKPAKKILCWSGENLVRRRAGAYDARPRERSALISTFSPAA